MKSIKPDKLIISKEVLDEVEVAPGEVVQINGIAYEHTQVFDLHSFIFCIFERTEKAIKEEEDDNWAFS